MWVTNPRLSPYNVEYLRFEPDTPGRRARCATDPHVAYRVADVDAALQGPRGARAGRSRSAAGSAGSASCCIDGAVIEFMQYANPDEEGWF